VEYKEEVEDAWADGLQSELSHSAVAGLPLAAPRPVLCFAGCCLDHSSKHVADPCRAGPQMWRWMRRGWRG
jgi:hypothetical protein